MGTPELTYSAESSLASACCPNFYFENTRTQKTNKDCKLHTLLDVYVRTIRVVSIVLLLSMNIARRRMVEELVLHNTSSRNTTYPSRDNLGGTPKPMHSHTSKNLSPDFVCRFVALTKTFPFEWFQEGCDAVQRVNGQ